MRSTWLGLAFRFTFKLFYNARRYHSPSFCNTDKGQRMTEMEAICFLLQVETDIRELASLSIIYIFLCVHFQQGHFGIQCIVFLVQALRENENANKHKLQIQKRSYHFQISAIAVHSCISALTVLLFLSKWLFLKVDLIYATQLCLDHISLDWGILSYLDAEQMIFKKHFFQYFRNVKMYFCVCTDVMRTYVDHTPKFFRKSPQIKKYGPE